MCINVDVDVGAVRPRRGIEKQDDDDDDDERDHERGGHSRGLASAPREARRHVASNSAARRDGDGMAAAAAE
jgi:hypothetical protein